MFCLLEMRSEDRSEILCSLSSTPGTDVDLPRCTGLFHGFVSIFMRVVGDPTGRTSGFEIEQDEGRACWPPPLLMTFASLRLSVPDSCEVFPVSRQRGEEWLDLRFLKWYLAGFRQSGIDPERSDEDGRPSSKSRKSGVLFLSAKSHERCS